MKETLLVAVAAAAIGACVGGGAVMFGSAQSSGTSAPMNPDAFAAAMERSLGRPLAEMRRDIATLAADAARRDVPAEDGGIPPSAASGDAPSPAAARDARRVRLRPESRRDTPISQPGTMARDVSTPLRAKNVARVGDLRVTTKDAQAKRREDWMFVTETALTDELGLPDEVNPDEGTETWRYTIPIVDSDGDPDEEDVNFRISRGRVIAVFGAEDIPK